MLRLAAALTLFATTSLPASAADRRVTIDQIGTASQIESRQSGFSQEAVLATDGDRHRLALIQGGDADNRLRASMTGADNILAARQDGDAGGGNDALVAQFGAANRLDIWQSATAGTANAIVAFQFGNGNEATLTQQGAGNRLDLTQTGDDNRATLGQVGNGLSLGVAQLGGAIISIMQTGY